MIICIIEKGYFFIFCYSVTRLPEKTTIYTTLVGLLNVRNYNFGGEVCIFCICSFLLFSCFFSCIHSVQMFCTKFLIVAFTIRITFLKWFWNEIQYLDPNPQPKFLNLSSGLLPNDILNQNVFSIHW